MVTLGFISICVSMSVLTIIFDIFVFKSTVLDAVLNIFYAEIAAGRIITIAAFLLGLGSSLVADYRLYKKKKSQKTQQKESGS
jgi:uncharacterized membrane protein YeiB